MPLIFMLIISAFLFVMSGMWLGSIVVDRVVYDRAAEWHQYLWTIVTFLLGTYMSITVVGHVANGVCK